MQGQKGGCRSMCAYDSSHCQELNLESYKIRRHGRGVVRLGLCLPPCLASYTASNGDLVTVALI